MRKGASQKVPRSSFDRISALLEGLALGLRGSGLAFALFLGFMRLAKLPCGALGGCDPVLASPYGSIAGIPLGFFAAALWLTSLLTSRDRLRRFALLILALGSVVFVYIQAFVLRTFCPWCMAHAVFSWLSYPGWRARGHWSAVLAAVLLAGCGHAVQRALLSEHAAPDSFEELAHEALPWLGVRTVESPVLVLGIDCQTCWETWLAPLGTLGWSPREGAPLVIWKTDARTRTLTEYFVATVIAKESGDSPALASALSVCAEERALFVSDPEKALAYLRRRFPDAEGKLGQAREIVERQAAQLERAGYTLSPLYLQRDLPPVTRSSFDEDFSVSGPASATP